ncbi:MAG: PDGLE domain-containing protein [Iamia sp.]
MTPRVRFGAFLAAGLAIVVLIAFLVSPSASSKPDGLERVAQDQGFSDEADDHALASSPAADYGVDGVDDDRMSTGLAGLIGVTVTFVLTGALFLAVRRRSGADGGDADHPARTSSPEGAAS